MVLILKYRRESLSDTTNTYPARTRLAAPSIFRTTLSVPIMPPFSYSAPGFDAVVSKKEVFHMSIKQLYSDRGRLAHGNGVTRVQEQHVLLGETGLVWQPIPSLVGQRASGVR